MTPVTVDLETFWSVTHSLSKMPAIAYCTHPETEVISLAYKFGDDKTHCIFGEDKIAAWAKSVDWSDKMVIGHNLSGFDSMILAWRFGIKPQMWACTLAMSRPWHMKDVGGSLAKLVAHYGLGVKDQSALIQTKGRHLKDFTPEEIDAMRTYNMMDVDQCWQLFKIFFKQTPKSEMKLIDMTVRMLVEPQFEVDVPLLETTLTEERERKHKMLIDLATTVGAWEPGMADEEVADAVSKTLGSAPKFTRLLKDLGVDVPTKISVTTGKEAPALAKTDEGFIALQNHDNPIVAAAAQARLGVKSTILETRIEAFLSAAKATGGKLPVPLRYYGGHTGRWSGEQYNLQNLPRVSGKSSDALRNCLMAGPGKKIVVADLSGIELRVNMTLWKVSYAMELFKEDPEADLYKPLASEVLGVPVEGMPKMVRQAGKAMHLGCGFALSKKKTYIAVAKSMANIVVTEDEAGEHIAGYRKKHPEIVAGWRQCQNALKYARGGHEFAIDPWGMCVTYKDGIKTPKGFIYYPDLRQKAVENGDRMAWVCGEGRNLTFLSGGTVDENCLAKGTRVLTHTGWKAIEFITTKDLVHDGVCFVQHGGKVSKSVQQCVSIDGVYMTPDHEVLDENDKWVAAQEAPKPYRPDLRSVDSRIICNVYEAGGGVDIPVRVRTACNESAQGRVERSTTRRKTKLRMLDQAANFGKKQNTWNGETPCVWRMAGYGRSLQATIAQGMEKLRRAWHYGMRTMAWLVRMFLVGPGAVIPAGLGFRSQGQQRAVLAGELPMGVPPGKHHEQAQYAACGHSCIGATNRDTSIYPVLPNETGASSSRASGQAQSYEVFDILDAGPRHRFVVLGDSGPFIVHNCVQHLARHVISDAMLEMRRQTGKTPCLSVHDELIYIVEEDEAQETLDTLQAIMRTPPVWWPELVVWSEGAIADTYGAAK